MCGICGILSTENISVPTHLLYDKFFSIKHRGPEKTVTVSDDKYALCFHRLAINDTSSMGDQPFNFSYRFLRKNASGEGMDEYRRSVYIMCNGEIYNSDLLKSAKDIKKKISDLSFTYKSKSDCEVLIPLFLSTINEKYYDDKINPVDTDVDVNDIGESIVDDEQENNKNRDEGLFKMMLRLSGEFSFSVYDIFTNMTTNETSYNLWLGRDRFGIRPLFYSVIDDKTVMFGSEMKCINFKEDEGDENYKNNKVQVADPRTWYLFSQNNEGKLIEKSDIYYGAGLYNIVANPDPSDVRREIKTKLVNSVKRRLHCDREIGCLLSGGFDSSVISAIAARELLFEGKRLRTFSIGMKNSPDVKHAQQVAEYINSVHTNIEIPKEDWIFAVEKIIEVTETFDVTTIRASIGQYLISKWIKENTDIKVLLIGDGSDEVAGGYLYFNNAPTPEEFHLECVRRLHFIHYFDVLRSDRGISSNGLEARVPFLDEEFVDLYLRVDPKLRVSDVKEIDGKKIRYEKYLLRTVFDKTDYLPKNIVWRKKEAFSDGVSPEGESWHTDYKNIIDGMISDEQYKTQIEEITTEPKPYSKESLYYYNVFQKMYPNQQHVLPYYWMPKWVEETNDPSARTLDIYKDEPDQKKQGI